MDIIYFATEFNSEEIIKKKIILIYLLLLILNQININNCNSSEVICAIRTEFNFR